MNLRVLNKKESLEIINRIIKQFDIKNLGLDYAFFQNEDKIFLISKDLRKVDFQKLRINNLGLYFCTLAKNGIRLTIEGTQLIGDKANKNIIDIKENELVYWFNGENLVRKDIDGFVIIKYKNDFLGCGYGKEGIIINYIPKERRVKGLIY
ncbi:MAG: hypothetical protein KJ623_03855 [Nanoarchaeota archaeon]|nr:hypothetical protein [Nanoarchaeota archaeon]MBU0962312.1 hypothetical protein [Nanoarchaeota archaeon]